MASFYLIGQHRSIIKKGFNKILLKMKRCMNEKKKEKNEIPVASL